MMGAKELKRLIACAELRNPKQFNASRERYIAEISFKAGMEEAGQVTEELLTKAVNAGIKTGGRESVERIRKDNNYKVMVKLVAGGYREMGYDSDWDFLKDDLSKPN